MYRLWILRRRLRCTPVLCDNDPAKTTSPAMSSQTHLPEQTGPVATTVVCSAPGSESLYRVGKLTQKPHTSTVNKTRPTRFPLSNNHAKTIFPENDFSSFAVDLKLSLLFSHWLVGFFSINFHQNHFVDVGWIPFVLDFPPGSQQCQQRKSHRSLRRRNR